MSSHVCPDCGSILQDCFDRTGRLLGSALLIDEHGVRRNEHMVGCVDYRERRDSQPVDCPHEYCPWDDIRHPERTE